MRLIPVLEPGNHPGLLHRGWSLKMLTFVPYAAFLVVSCPGCKAPAGVNCHRPDGSPVPPIPGRGLGEEVGAHVSRVDTWYRLQARIADDANCTPYSEIETVACPKCKAAPGVRCDAKHRRGDSAKEDHGIHAARSDAWIASEKRAHAKKMQAIFRAEEAEDRDRARRGLPRNMATGE